MTSMISICSKTAIHLRKLLKDTGHKHILLSVSGGGCNGMKYNIDADSELPEKGDDDFIVNDVPVRVCGKSIMYLIGMELNWVTDARGSRMEFDNPNAASSCGCGETFNV